MRHFKLIRDLVVHLRLEEIGNGQHGFLLRAEQSREALPVWHQGADPTPLRKEYIIETCGVRIDRHR